MPVLRVNSSIEEAIKLDSLLQQVAVLLGQEVNDRLGGGNSLVEKLVDELLPWAFATACSERVHHPGLPDVCMTWQAAFGHKHLASNPVGGVGQCCGQS